MKTAGKALIAASCIWCAWVCEATELPPPVVHESLEFGGAGYDVVTVDLEQSEVRLYWKTDDDTSIRGLRGLQRHLQKEGHALLFATNAGIYSKDFTPAGLHVEGGKEIHKINVREGGGNFHLKPNGIFYIDREGAHVLESSAYQRRAPQPLMATQSGPILVVHNDIHPKFRADSTSKYIRSGVGVRSPKEAVFVISREPVNFHSFASLFKERLLCPDALYLDGEISRFYMPGVLEDSGPALFVGMLAVVAKEEDRPAHKPENDG